MSVPKRVLVPVDFSDCSKNALEYALGLSEPLGAKVEVLHVWDIGWVSPDLTVWAGESKKSVLEFAKQEAELMLEDLLQSHAGLTGELAHGQAAEEIAKKAEAGFDLVVMGTHGRTGLSHLVMGSVAQKVVRLAHCPVLTVPLRQEG
jgi:nucleotide-binding universal stress UspA family protein